MIKIGIFGKPNSGKSTFFSAATMKHVKISEIPFTTIEPNIGLAYVRSPCPHTELGKECNPKNSLCIKGMRFIPVELIDVAGLISEAHKGKGLGNQFLNDLMRADVLIHIVDMSGKFGEDGTPCEDYDPEKDIREIYEELVLWVKELIEKDWRYISKGIYEPLYKRLSGLKIKEETIKEVLNEGFTDSYDLASKIVEKGKPIVIAGNKVDLNDKHFRRLSEKYKIIPCSALSELVLKKAVKAGKIEYIPGEGSFEVIGNLSPEEKKGLEYVEEKVLKKFGNTGVQQILEKCVFNVMNMIPVYPVEDEKKWCDAKGNVLPDVFLMETSSTPLDLAFRIHSDIGNNFIGAIDCRTGKKLGKDYQLKKNDVIKILHRG
jgi:ribosome-binding ATPase YchF (GTP1/OBG family)